MEDIQRAYNSWADQYDTNDNKTRDLEAIALRKTLREISFKSVLEIGCGTGKNSAWFIDNAQQVFAVDFSEEMLARAKSKITSGNIEFKQADITQPWSFTTQQFDLVSFSLVLEHIGDLDFIFSEIQKKITHGGYVYIGELHPFKQYQGSLARFNTEAGIVQLRCYTHNISEFLLTSKAHGFTLVDFQEWFDENEPASVPRILSLLFKFQ